MTKVKTLSRETSLPKVKSQMRRSLLLLRKAHGMATKYGTESAVTKAKERALGAWAQSRRVAFVRKPSMRTARVYVRAHKAWQAFYNQHIGG